MFPDDSADAAGLLVKLWHQHYANMWFHIHPMPENLKQCHYWRLIQQKYAFLSCESSSSSICNASTLLMIAFHINWNQITKSPQIFRWSTKCRDLMQCHLIKPAPNQKIYDVHWRLIWWFEQVCSNTLITHTHSIAMEYAFLKTPGILRHEQASDDRILLMAWHCILLQSQLLFPPVISALCWSRRPAELKDPINWTFQSSFVFQHIHTRIHLHLQQNRKWFNGSGWETNK